VQIYDSYGNTVGSSTNLYASTRYTSQSVTSGQKYYIKVWPYNGNNGSYQITFNASSTTPGGSSSGGTWTPSGGTPTQLTVNQWANGNISSSSGQWFTFTATASTQYIHITFGTLPSLYLQLYDSYGNTVGSSTNLYNGSSYYTSRSVTSGQKYYIKVSQALGNGSYQIAFNASSSTPN